MHKARVAPLSGPTASNRNGTPIDFGKVRYPGILSNCANCHADGTWRLPVADGVLPTRMEYRTCDEEPADRDSYCSPAHFRVSAVSLVLPETAVCTSCHDGPETFAHAAVMTVPTGITGIETCVTCHGPGAPWDVDLVHDIR